MGFIPMWDTLGAELNWFCLFRFCLLTVSKQVTLSDADPQDVQAHLGKMHAVSEVIINI